MVPVYGTMGAGLPGVWSGGSRRGRVGGSAPCSCGPVVLRSPAAGAVRGFGVAPHTGRLARAVRARQGRRRRARVAPVLLTGIVCACVRPSVCARAVFAALARKRRAVSVVAAGAAMALLALAAVAISDSNERTELVYRSSLDNTLNPAAGSGKVRPPIWTRLLASGLPAPHPERGASRALQERCGRPAARLPEPCGAGGERCTALCTGRVGDKCASVSPRSACSVYLQGGWATGDPMTSWGPGSLEETYTGENADAPGIPCKLNAQEACVLWTACERAKRDLPSSLQLLVCCLTLPSGSLLPVGD